MKHFLLFIVSLVLTDILLGLLYPYNIIPLNSGENMVQFLLKNEILIKVQPHPYLLYVNTPGWKRDGIRQINTLGYRGSEITQQPAQDTLRILVLGGSTTWSDGVANPKDSWPAQLEKILQDQTDKKVEVINGGLDSSTSAEWLAHYMFRDRYLGAKIVIIHADVNDAIALMLNHYNPEYTHYRSQWDLPKLRRFEKTLLKSNILKILYGRWLGGPVLFGSKSPTTLTAQQVLKNVTTQEPIGLRRNLDLLVRNILQDGATPIFFDTVLAPRAVTHRSEEAMSMDYIWEPMQIAFHKNLEINEEIAKKYSIPHIQIPPESIPLDFFVDHCHLNKNGENLKARFVSENLSSIITAKRNNGEKNKIARK